MNAVAFTGEKTAVAPEQRFRNRPQPPVLWKTGRSGNVVYTPRSAAERTLATQHLLSAATLLKKAPET
jgi:hypothetical protein